MDTSNYRVVASALPVSLERMGYLMEGERVDGRESGPPEFSHTGRNATAKAATTCSYCVRAWYLTGRAGPLSCSSQVGYGVVLPQ
ncbi:hypothetical protein EVAR_35833_1 [Eumeta japonica]|uniref:Uncharacterized protein n=1 Tax=Eumeta variegata TaxID=151549 RepID=A0A4C1WVZ1_EUMVA|nr:hypothetical protein EVAR_35833_1 [Eumeta japonica]